MPLLARDAEALHLAEIGQDVGPELVPGDERLRPVVPVAVEEMAVGVRPEVMAVGSQAADRSRELGYPVEIPREEEARLDAFVREDPADVLPAVGEGAPGEDERHPPDGRVAADDRALVQGEVPAGTAGRGRAALAGAATRTTISSDARRPSRGGEKKFIFPLAGRSSP